MTWLVAAIYDQVMRASEGACLAQWRSELVRSVAGEVLEVGAGTGAMLPHYPPPPSRALFSPNQTAT